MESSEAIASYLVQTGVLSQQRLQDLLKVACDGECLLSCALAYGAAPERPLARALAVQYGHPVLVFAASSLDLSALQLVPLVVSLNHQVLPVAIDANTITIAAARHGKRPIFDQIAYSTGREVVVLLALEIALREATEAAYSALSNRMSHWSGAHASQYSDLGATLLSTESFENVSANGPSKELPSGEEEIAFLPFRSTEHDDANNTIEMAFIEKETSSVEADAEASPSVDAESFADLADELADDDELADGDDLLEMAERSLKDVAASCGVSLSQNAAPAIEIDYDVLFREATVAYMTGDLNTALRMFERCLEHKPDDSRALHNIERLRSN